MAPRQPTPDPLAAGDRREALQAIREKLAVELRAAEGQNAATLARVLADVVKELAALDAVKERSTTDELAQRRKARRAPAAPAKCAARGDHRGG